MVVDGHQKSNDDTHRRPAADGEAPRIISLPVNARNDREREHWEKLARGWFGGSNAIILRHGADLGPIGLAVYCTLDAFAGKRRTCTVDHITVAHLLGISSRIVQDYVQRLESLGLVTVKRAPPKCNQYRLPQRAKGKYTEPGSAYTEPGSAYTEPGSAYTEPGSDKQETLQETLPKNTHKNARVSTGFEEFWAAYPRKEKKKEARAVWESIAPDAALRARILTAVELRRKSPDWAAPRFIPLAANWLEGERWEDEVAAPSADTDSRKAAREQTERILQDVERGQAAPTKIRLSKNGKGEPCSQ